MPESASTWEQLALLPHSVLTLSITVGLSLDDDHAQIQIEVRNPVTGELLAMQSWPALSLHDFEDRMRDAGREFTRLLLDATAPFTT